MDKQTIAHDFKSVTDTPAHIEKWIDEDNETVREKASLDKKNEYDIPTGRHNAEKVLKLKEKSPSDWTDADYKFAAQVVNYAKRSAGISTHHAHNEKSEVGDTRMTKNEIARRNWGLPAKPKKAK